MKLWSRLIWLLAGLGCSSEEGAALPAPPEGSPLLPVAGTGTPPVDADADTISAPEALQLLDYDIPRTLGPCSAERANPHDPAVDRATGLVYFTDSTTNCIGQLDPVTLQYRAWPAATPQASPHGLVIVEGVVYFTGQSANVLGSIDPATGAAEDFPVDMLQPHTPAWQAGAIWFSGGLEQYGRFDPQTKQSSVYDFASRGSSPYGIWPAPDGSLWVALFGTNRLARIDPSSAPPSSEEFVLPAPDARPRRLAVAADGRVWYTDYPRRRLGVFDPNAPEAERQREFPTPAGGRPYGIVIGPDDRVWYDDQDAGEIVGFDPATERVVAQLVLPVPNPGPARNMDVDRARQRIWLSLSDIGHLAVIQF